MKISPIETTGLPSSSRRDFPQVPTVTVGGGFLLGFGLPARGS